MINLIAAAALAAQPAPVASADHQHMPMSTAQHAQHDSKKMDCCKHCCEDMATKHDSHDSRHADNHDR